MAAQTVATPPVPDGTVTDWVHPDDYPPASMRAGEEGRVSVQLDVDASGMVTGCHVTNSSSHPLLDARTCTILTQRAHFRPARDVAGRAIAATTSVMSFRWQIPVDTSPTSPLSAEDAKIREEAAASLQILGSSPLPADQPVTPDRLRLAEPLVRGMRSDDEAKMESFWRSTAESAFAARFAGLPPRSRALAKADLAAAFDIVWQQNLRLAHDRVLRFYAARLNDGEIRELTAFFQSGVGYKQIHHMAPLTAEDRQAFGRAMAEHPAVAKWARLGMDFLQTTMAEAHDMGVASQAKLKAALCLKLAQDHIPLPICPMVKPIPVTGKARPARLLTTHL
ncbi:TonB family protein [Sphingomonas zeae]